MVKCCALVPNKNVHEWQEHYPLHVPATYSPHSGTIIMFFCRNSSPDRHVILCNIFEAYPEHTRRFHSSTSLSDSRIASPLFHWDKWKRGCFARQRLLWYAWKRSPSICSDCVITRQCARDFKQVLNSHMIQDARFNLRSGLITQSKSI